MKPHHTFISYTLRDGYITKDILQRIKQHFDKYGTSFVDLLDNDSSLIQDRIFDELNKADTFVLLETPETLNSPWVSIEIEKAKDRKLTIRNLSIDDIKNITSSTIASKIIDQI